MNQLTNIEIRIIRMIRNDQLLHFPPKFHTEVREIQFRKIKQIRLFCIPFNLVVLALTTTSKASTISFASKSNCVSFVSRPRYSLCVCVCVFLNDRDTTGQFPRSFTARYSTARRNLVEPRMKYRSVVSGNSEGVARVTFLLCREQPAETREGRSRAGRAIVRSIAGSKMDRLHSIGTRYST